MKKLWVRISKLSTYESGSEWKLGTVVGETSIPYANNDSLQQALEGAKMSKHYLIELDDGRIEEAWFWDTYEPVSGATEELPN